MIKKLTPILLISVIGISNAYAKQSSIQPYFHTTNGCFMLYDITDHHMIEHFNPKRCSQRIAADSTFKIALSLMAFDQQLITQQTVFKWDGKHRALPQWNHNQTPHSWLKNSAIWVSQHLTPKLGLSKINQYLNTFHYGNCDFSGHPGKHDGLTHAWLSSSLKISANEQLHFLAALVDETLPISKQAMKNTKHNMRLQSLPNQSILYGKTGSGTTTNGQHDGWFIGFVTQNNKTIIFITNVSYDNQYSKKAGGFIAKNITLKVLNDKHLS